MEAQGNGEALKARAPTPFHALRRHFSVYFRHLTRIKGTNAFLR
jgi:hypothetical protein